MYTALFVVSFFPRVWRCKKARNNCGSRLRAHVTPFSRWHGWNKKLTNGFPPTVSDVSSHLLKRVCPSVCWLIRLLVGPLLHPSVHLSVCPLVTSLRQTIMHPGRYLTTNLSKRSMIINPVPSSSFSSLSFCDASLSVRNWFHSFYFVGAMSGLFFVWYLHAFLLVFLVANTRLYKSLCWSRSWNVCQKRNLNATETIFKQPCFYHNCFHLFTSKGIKLLWERNITAESLIFSI